MPLGSGKMRNDMLRRQFAATLSRLLPAKKVTLPIAFLVFGGGITFWLVQSRPPAAQAAVPEPSLLVSVATLKREPVTFTVASQGAVSPRTETTLVSEVSGQIVQVSPAFVSGGIFKRGDVLVRIDPRIYETNLKRAEAEVARAQTQVATEEARASYAHENWERLRSLDVAEGDASDLTLRKPQLQEAVAGLAAREADLEKAQEDLRRTVIRAPYDGMVRKKLADVGQFVNVGSQLANTFAVDRAEVRLPLTQHDLRFVDLDALATGGTLPVTLRADLGAERKSWQAEVVRSEGVFDSTSRVLYVVAQVEDPYDLAGHGGSPLRIGTFVSAEIHGTTGGDFFAVPRHALAGGETLWVVNEAMQIHPRSVNIVRADEQFAYISEGLMDGERYVTIPIPQPLPGMRVRVGGG